MKATDFMKMLNQSNTTPNSQLTAQQFFDTQPGKNVLQMMTSELTNITATSFEITSAQIDKIEASPFYYPRKFLDDMKDLGFNYKILSSHED